MNILFVSRSFDQITGGMERMVIMLMNAMCERGHTVHLISWDHTTATPFYPLDPRIQWHKLAIGDASKKGSFKTRMDRLIKFRALVKKTNPDVILAFQHGPFLATWVYTIGLFIPIICAERTAPTRMKFLSEGRRKNFVFQTMRLAKWVTIQCESYRQSYPHYLRNRIVTISNPVPPASIYAQPAGLDAQRKILLSVGRLSYQKNFPALFSAFATLAPTYPDWDLHIAGDGEDLASLDHLITELNMSGRIHLRGAIKDMANLYAASHLFTLASRWEGFPNALAEAMAHGLPCVGYADCAGTRDLIEDHKTGLLANGNGDIDTLSTALATLMNDAILREQYGQAGIAAMTHYQPQHIFDQWEDLLGKSKKNRVF